MTASTSDTAAAPAISDRLGRRIAVTISIALHVAILCALVVWYIAQQNAAGRARAAAALAMAEQAARASAQTKASRPSPAVTSGQVQATVNEAQEKFENVSTADKLIQLDEQAERLENVANKKSVAEIADKFEEWIPTPERASEPAAAPVAGEFDFDTAQIHDVLRTAAEDGYDYRTVLVDAQGRTFEVEIDRVEGEKTYATFESLKKFPLANQVYRQIAMRLIDKALAERSNQPAASEPPSVSSDTPTETDNRDPFDNTDSP